MKKIILTLLAIALTVVQSFAQRDVKTLIGASDAQIKAIFGSPDNYLIGDADSFFYYYPNVTLVLTNPERNLEAFWTDSPDYCILTKYIPGGIKIGDPFSKLQEVDFSKVDYGRNDPENALSPDSDPTFNYVIFKNEYHQVSFRVEDGIIREWIFTTEQDANPNKTYINFWE